MCAAESTYFHPEFCSLADLYALFSLLESPLVLHQTLLHHVFITTRYYTIHFTPHVYTTIHFYYYTVIHLYYYTIHFYCLVLHTSYISNCTTPHITTHTFHTSHYTILQYAQCQWPYDRLKMQGRPLRPIEAPGQFLTARLSTHVLVAYTCSTNAEVGLTTTCPLATFGN